MIPTATSSRLVLVITLLLSLIGYVTTATAQTPSDPWESYNRAMFSFNEGLDRMVIKPVAKGYEKVVPTPVNIMITNFFNNIDDVAISVNNLLQGKVKDSATDLGRVALNSTLGIAGLIDVASDMECEKHDEDFGLTFGHWGFSDGPYVVLPVIGPRTVRDSFGLLADWPADPLTWIKPDISSYSLIALRQVDIRADLLPAEKVFEAGAIDKYSYMRDAYLQRRRYLVYDGHPPRDEN
jgi:phospholipid-binding lipoprotein MlaA